MIRTLNLLQIHEHLSIPIYPLNCIRIGEVKFVVILLLLRHIEILILVYFPRCLILLLEPKDQRDHVQCTRSITHSLDSTLRGSPS